MLNFEFGYRLAEPHPLKTLELAQRPIEVPFEARFVAEQIIELRCERKVLPQRPSSLTPLWLFTLSENGSPYFSFRYSVLACLRMGMSASASFQRVRKS